MLPYYKIKFKFLRKYVYINAKNEHTQISHMQMHKAYPKSVVHSSMCRPSTIVRNSHIDEIQIPNLFYL
jgi:hypothetical protein